MNRLELARIVCSILPPLVSQKVRNAIFPLEAGRRMNADFTRKSITGAMFTGNTSDYHSYRMAVNGYFEWRNIVIANFFIKNSNADVIEIGANVGTETVSFCDLTGGTVHAFEPMPANIAALKTLHKNLRNLALYEIAASDKATTASFKMPPETSSGTGKIVTSETTVETDNVINIDAAPLDKFLESFNDVRFMSIDTEGHEPFVLKGAEQTIRKFRPAIVIEVSPGLLRKYAKATSADIQSFFKSHGYRCYSIDPFSLKEVTNAMLDSPKAHNWLCVGEEQADSIKKLSRRLKIRMLLPWFLLGPIKH